MATTHADLASAAQTALHAPSILNTQPWRWRVAGGTLELLADPSRQLQVIDPDGRQLTISCGIALHHARIALAASGRSTVVQRLPHPDQPELLARVRVVGEHEPDPDAARLCEAIAARRTDRRPFADEPVAPESLDRLRDAAESQRAHLHILRPDDVPALATAVTRAGAVEMGDPAYRAELARWTRRADPGAEGVPVGTATPASPRTVPLRDLTLDDAGALTIGEGTDRSAVYAILASDSDDPAGWLRGGEAMSAVLLTAVVEGLAVSPISDVTEVGTTREQLRWLLRGIGHALLVLRIGHPASVSATPATPRRNATATIEIDV